MTNKKFKIAAMSMALTACVAAQPLMANAADPDEGKEPVPNAAEHGASEGSAIAGNSRAEEPAAQNESADKVASTEPASQGSTGEESENKDSADKSKSVPEEKKDEDKPLPALGTDSNDVKIDYKDPKPDPNDKNTTITKGDVIDLSKKDELTGKDGKDIGDAAKTDTDDPSSTTTKVTPSTDEKDILGKTDDGSTLVKGTETTVTEGTGEVDSKTEITDTKEGDVTSGGQIDLDDELGADKDKLTWSISTVDKDGKQNTVGGYDVDKVTNSEDGDSKEITLKKHHTEEKNDMSAEDIAKLLDGAKKSADGKTYTKTEPIKDKDGKVIGSRTTRYEVTGKSVSSTTDTTLTIRMEKKENTGKEDFSDSNYTYPSSSTVRGDNGKDYNFVLKDVLKNAEEKDGKLIWEDTEHNLTYVIGKSASSSDLTNLSNDDLAALLNKTSGKNDYSSVNGKLYYTTADGEVCEVANADNKLLRETLKYTITITDHHGSKSDTRVDGSGKTVEQANEEAKKNAKEAALKKAFADAVKQETGKEITDIDLSRIDGDQWTWTDFETGKTYTFSFTYKENESGTHDTTITRENVTDVTENTESGTTTVTGSTVIWTESGKTYTDETINNTFGGGYNFTKDDEARLKEKFDIKDVMYDEETGKLKSFTTVGGKTYTFQYESVGAPDGLGNITADHSFTKVTWNITKKETKPDTSAVTGEDKHFEIKQEYTKETAEDGSLTIRDKDGKVLYEKLKKVDGKDNVYTNADDSVTITINKTTLSKDDVKKEIEGRINGVTDVKVNEDGTFSYKIGDVTYTGTYDSTAETLDVTTKTVIEGSSTTISASSTDDKKARAELREKLNKLQAGMGEDEELVINGKHFGKHTDVETIIKSFKTAINYKDLSAEELLALLLKQKADADAAGKSYTGEGVIHNDKNQPDHGHGSGPDHGNQPDHSIGSNPNFIGHLDLATDSDLLLEDGTTMDAILLNKGDKKFKFEWNLKAEDLINKDITDNQAKFQDTISYDDGKQNGGDGSKGHYEYERGNGRTTWIDNDNDNYPHQSAFYRLTGTIAYGSLENGKEYDSEQQAQAALNNWRAKHSTDKDYKPNIVKMTVTDDWGNTKTVYKAYRYESSLTAYGYMSKDSNTCVNSRYGTDGWGNPKWAGGYDLRISGLTQVSKTESTAHGTNYYDYSADISRVKKDQSTMSNTLLDVKPTSRTENKEFEESAGGGNGLFGSYGLNKREEHDYTSEDCNYNVVESTGSDSYITYRDWQDVMSTVEETLEKIGGSFGFRYKTTKDATAEAVSKTETTVTKAHLEYNYTTVSETETIVVIPPETPGEDGGPVTPVLPTVTPETPAAPANPELMPDAAPDAPVLPSDPALPAVQDAHALPQTGVNWLAAIGMALSGLTLMITGAFASLTYKDKH